ncbi:type II toxin-antitoxin system HipA family toxin [Marinobacter sp. GN3S48]|uniref:type II toxin-antitoxin system HipA family toxin n=1 Tax=Marinobacter sp. GN3S48 TaxID=3382302 RepID=UPI00387AA426
MSHFEPVRKLQVSRRMASGDCVPVGTLAQNRDSVFFQYDENYLNQGHSLSPFNLAFDDSLQAAPKMPHGGLHGLFADSLPDGWGLLLMDRVFRRQGILPNQLTAMDRLAYIGDRGMGALVFQPVSELAPKDGEHTIDLTALGRQAVEVFEGQTDEVLKELAQAGSSGGARPKAQIYLGAKGFEDVSTLPAPGRTPWLVKFTSASLALGHEEGLCEAAYLNLARQAGITVPEWQLIPAPETTGATAWLALKRFDCHPDLSHQGRYHLQSACGLLDADFRMPSLDYEDLIKATHILCKSMQAAREQFRRALFNLFTANQDDHSKNWSFLMDDLGHWHPAPFYDPTFSPGPHGEHSTAYQGHGKRPPLNAIQAIAAHAGYSRWSEVRNVIREVVDTIAGWEQEAKALGVSASTRKLIARHLDQTRKDNSHLLQ